MIIWLASYPRSGNTLFRIALQRMGLGPTYSAHDDSALKRLSIDEEIGHSDLPENGLDELRRSKKLFFVKTHNLPEDDDSPAIYIVRDGREAIASYAHYLKDIEGKDIPFFQLVAKLICGEAGTFGLWSDHVCKWKWKKGSVTIVNFDDLVANPVEIVAKALNDINYPFRGEIKNVNIPNFSELQNMNSKFFRKGKKNSWLDDITPMLERQFWRWNRVGMTVSGFSRPSSMLPHSASALPEIMLDTIVGRMEAFEPILDDICMPPYLGPDSNQDFSFLMNLAKKINPEYIFEYGTASGNTVANLCKYTSARVVTLNALLEDTSGSYRTYDLAKDEIGSVYIKYGFQDRVQQIYCDSMNFVPEAYTNAKFDLVIIDACHDFEYVLNDFLSISHLVGENGYVIFHDCDESMSGHLSGVWRACTHLRRAGYNIKKVQGTWWALWSSAEQEDEIDSGYISLLEYEIEKTIELNVLNMTARKELTYLRSKLKIVRESLVSRIQLWLHKILFR